MSSVLVVAAWISLAVHAGALTWIDARTHRLPNRWVASCAALGVVLLGLAGWMAGDLTTVTRGLLVGTGAALVFLVIHLCGGMGMGDVKYAWVLGFYLGTLSADAAWWGLWLSFALAAAVVVARRILRYTPGRRIPFGPYMTVGSAIASTVFVLP